MKVEIRETGPMPVNTYILKDENSKEAVIIDVGGDFENIKQKLDAEKYTVKYILNTHGHFDHVLGEPYIQKNYPQIPIYMSKDDLPHIINMKEEMNFFDMTSTVESLKLDSFIDENSQLFIGKYKIQVLATPGHSKGSLSFYTDGKLFSGDTIFSRSIGRTDFYDGDFDAIINSIMTKLTVLPDDTIVFPGHGLSTTIRNEKLFNTYLT